MSFSQEFIQKFLHLKSIAVVETKIKFKRIEFVVTLVYTKKLMSPSDEKELKISIVYRHLFDHTFTFNVI